MQSVKKKKIAKKLQKLLDIEKNRRKTLKNEKKSNSNKKLFIYFYFLYRKTYILLKNIFEKLSLFCYFVLQLFRVAGYCKCSNKTPRPI